jgi:hypothetical protein
VKALTGDQSFDASGRPKKASALNQILAASAFQSLLARRHRPAGVVDVENDAVGVLELSLEPLVTLLAEIEKEFTAGRFDRRLPFLEIIDLEPKVMEADEGCGSFRPEPTSLLYCSSARLTSPSLI